MPIVATARRHLEQAPYRAPTARARRPGRRAVKHRRNPLVRVHEEGGRLATSLRNASAHPLTSQGPTPKQRALMDGWSRSRRCRPCRCTICSRTACPRPLRDRIGRACAYASRSAARRAPGVVAGFADAAPPGDLRAVLEVLDAEPFLPPDLLELCRWTARYYLASLADVIATIVPRRVAGRQPQERVVRLVRRLDAGERGRARATRPGPRARLPRCSPPRRRRARDRATRAPPASRPAALRALVRAGLAEARRAPRARGPRLRPSRPGRRLALTAAQRAAARRDRRRAVARRRHRVVPPPRRHRQRQDRGLPRRRRADARRGPRRPAARARDRAHAPARRRACAARFGDAVAVLHSGLGPRERWDEWRRIRARRGARRRRRALGGVRAARPARPRRRRRGARRRLQAGGRHPLQCARPGRRARAARRRPSSCSPRRRRRRRATTRRSTAGTRCSSCPSGRRRSRCRPSSSSTCARAAARRRRRRCSSDELRERARGEPRARRADARVPEPPRLRDLSPVPGVRRRRELPALQRHAHLAPRRAARSSAITATTSARRRRPAPECGGPPLEAFGVGTEQIEAHAAGPAIPVAAVDRLDRDAAQRPGAQRRILRDWHAGDTDILVGTQMVSKGHDVPGRDAGGGAARRPVAQRARLPRRRAHVPAARAGRRPRRTRRRGRAASLVQTLRPEHPSLVAAARHDYAGFMARRARAPARARLSAVRPARARCASTARDEQRSSAPRTRLAERLREHATTLGLGERAVLGPAPPPVERVRGRHRRQILLRSATVPALRALARAARAAEPALRRDAVRLVIDVDPYSA